MFFDFLIVGLSIGVVYGIVALGISLIYSGLDIVHFAHGEIFMLGAFIGLVFFNTIGLPYPIALIATMIATAAIGIFIERVFYRRLTRSGGGYTVAGMGMIIVGFGMAIILQNLAFLTWGATSFGYDPIYGPAVELGGITLPRSYLWIAVVAITLMAILNLFLQRTKLGLAVRAVAANKEIASLMGINVPLMISVIFGVACGLGAAGGVLIGPINFVSVEMGYLMLIKAFSAAVIGGFGSLPGAILGGLLLGVAETFGAAYISGSHKDIYAFILLIVVLMIKPSGLMGVIVKVKA